MKRPLVITNLDLWTWGQHCKTTLRGPFTFIWGPFLGKQIIVVASACIPRVCLCVVEKTTAISLSLYHTHVHTELKETSHTSSAHVVSKFERLACLEESRRFILRWQCSQQTLWVVLVHSVVWIMCDTNTCHTHRLRHYLVLKLVNPSQLIFELDNTI